MAQRIFLDTNIWFSFLYGSKNCQAIVNAHTKGKISAVVSPEVLTELIRNLKLKIPHTFPAFERILFSFPPEIVEEPLFIPFNIKSLVHQKDQGILMAAINAKVKYFVTGNTKDFRIAKLEKLTRIKILTPEQTVKILKL